MASIHHDFKQLPESQRYRNLKPFNDAIKDELKILKEIISVMTETDRELVAHNYKDTKDNIYELRRQLILLQQEMKEQYFTQYQGQGEARLSGFYYGDEPSANLEEQIIETSMKQYEKHHKRLEFSLDSKKLEQKHVKYATLDKLIQLFQLGFQQIEVIHEVLHNTKENVLVKEYKSIQNYLRDVKSLMEIHMYPLPRQLYKEQLYYELRKLGYMENFSIFF